MTTRDDRGTRRRPLASLLALVVIATTAGCTAIPAIPFGSPSEVPVTQPVITPEPPQLPTRPAPSVPPLQPDGPFPPPAPPPPAPTTEAPPPPPTTRPAPPAGPVITVSDLAQFLSPSGNIGCVMTPDLVRCDIYTDTSWTAPRPSGCELAWGNSLVLTDRGRSGCVGDYIGDAPLGNSTTRWHDSGRDPVVTKNGGRHAALGYGSTMVLGKYRCESERTGVTCRNTATGGLIFISRGSYEVR